MSKKLQNKEQFFLLVEAGFIAVNQADEDSAVKLFRACEILNPSSTLSKVGIGYLHFHKLELKRAAEIFKEVLEKEPGNEMAKTLLAMSFSLTSSHGAEGEKMLTDIAKKSDDPQVKKVANTTIDFVDQFVKKEQAPLEVQKKPPQQKNP